MKAFWQVGSWIPFRWSSTLFQVRHIGGNGAGQMFQEKVNFVRIRFAVITEENRISRRRGKFL
ncbi:hypothetical protein X738_24620 [Mesorhizobium sp. LNHC209A00]|nr:hypothetical protein X738_24620 [Mesorhizobium sp. LNHC209A00]